MASGSISGSTNNRYIVAQINWQARANVSGNYSDVSAQLFYRRTNSGYTTSGTIGGVIDIDGTDYGYGGRVSIGSGWVQVASASKRVYHNNDGTKGIWIGATGGISGTSMSSTSCGSGVNLDTIPRASGMSLSTSTIATGGSFTVNISPHSSGFSHWIDITGVGDHITYEVAAGVTSCTCTIPKERVTTFPNSQSAQATVYLNTKTGSGHDTKIGVVSQAITVTVPSDVKPSIGSVTLTDATKAYSVLGAYAAGFSQVTVTVPASVYHTDFTDTATIKSVTAVYNNTTYNAASGSFNFVPQAVGSTNMTITATDSRGMTSSVTKAITVKAYSQPTISVSASRCTSSGAADDTGAYATVTLPATLDSTNVSGNSAAVTLQYRPVGSTSSWTSVSVGTITKTQTLTKLISASDTQAFDLIATITDKITSNSAAMKLSNAQVPLDFLKGGKGIAIGKTATREGLDIAFSTYVEGDKLYVDEKTILDKFFPIGKMWISTDPTSPASIVGGSWEQLEAGRTIVAAGTGYTAGSTGGSSTHRHTYGIHNWAYHGLAVEPSGANEVIIFPHSYDSGASDWSRIHTYNSNNTRVNTGAQANKKSINNVLGRWVEGYTTNDSSLQPYFSAYVWRRIA